MLRVEGFSQEEKNYTYKIKDMSYEGVRLNGKAICPPKFPPILCNGNDTIEVSDNAYCKIDRYPEGVASVFHCCCEKIGRKRGNKVLVKEMFGKKVDKHFRKKHQKKVEPIRITVLFKGDLNINDLYNKIGQCSANYADEKYSAIDTLDKYNDAIIKLDADPTFMSYFGNDEKNDSSHLMVKNNTGKTQYIVTYVREGKSVRRIEPIELLDKHEEEICVVEKNNSQIFYVFYCDKFDNYWQRLNNEGTIKCCKITREKE